MTETEIQEWKDKIDKMSHIEMCKLWRFAPAGHPVFRSNLPLFKYFDEKYVNFGGMTAEISKAIGWGDGNSIMDS